MKYNDYILKAKINQKKDEERCRDWLKEKLRFKFQLNHKRQTIPVKLISKGIEDGRDCEDIIREALRKMRDCYGTFEVLAKRINKDADLGGLQMIIDELSQDTNSTIPTHLSEELKAAIDEFIRNCAQGEYLDPFYAKNSKTHPTGPTAEDLKRVLLDKSNREDFLKTLSKYAAQLNLSERIKDDSFIKQLFAKNNSKFLKELFKLTDEDLPDEPGDFCLGKYFHSGKIHIYLDPIYALAKRLKLDPYLLYRKVLIHELAHAFHHRGFDANASQWGNFGNQFQGREELVEGLANWHCMHYMIELDAKTNSYNNLHTLLCCSNVQPTPYQHYLKWVLYSFENIRNRILFARALQPSKLDLKTFEDELDKCHKNGE